MTKFIVKIPEPCNEVWDIMKPNDKGRFCDSCQKNVFDFVNSSDKQILKSFKENSNLCGRFNVEQLNRDLIVSRDINPIWLASKTIFISFLSLMNNNVYSQVKKVKIEQTDKKIISKKLNTINLINEVEVSGVIYDDKNNIIPNFGVYHLGKKIEESNIHGEFCINIKMGDTIVFWYDDLESYEAIRHIVSNQSKNIKIISEKSRGKKISFVGGAVIIKKTFLKEFIPKLKVGLGDLRKNFSKN